MKRALLVALLGCSTPPPPCTSEDCLAWCTMNVSPYEADLSDRATAPRLTDVEMRLLQDRLVSFRAGAVLTSPEALRFCVDGGDCSKTVARPIRSSLEPGGYQLQMELRVPQDGSWELVYERRCTQEEGARCQPLEDQRAVRTLKPGPEGTMLLPALDRFEVFDGPCATTCDATMTISGGNEPIVYDLRWSAPDLR